MEHYRQFNTYKEGLDLDTLRQWVAFVERGCFKYMVHNDGEGKNYCTGFAFEGEFVADFPNCMYSKPANISIIAYTTCEIRLIDGNCLKQLFDSNDNMKELHGNIYKNLFLQIYSQYLDIYRMTVKERYIQLLRRSPHIVQLINLKDIASFLKVTPTTISKIRKEITFST